MQKGPGSFSPYALAMPCADERGVQLSDHEALSGPYACSNHLVLRHLARDGHRLGKHLRNGIVVRFKYALQCGMVLGRPVSVIGVLPASATSFRCVQSPSGEPEPPLDCSRTASAEQALTTPLVSTSGSTNALEAARHSSTTEGTARPETTSLASEMTLPSAKVPTNTPSHAADAMVES